MSRVGSRSLNGGTVVLPHCRAQQHVKIPELSWHRLRWVVVGRPVEPQSQDHCAAKHSRVYTSKDVDIKHRSASCKAHASHTLRTVYSSRAKAHLHRHVVSNSKHRSISCATCLRRLFTSKSLGSHREPVSSGSTRRPLGNGFRRLRRARFRTTTFGRWKGVQGLSLGVAMSCLAAAQTRGGWTFRPGVHLSVCGVRPAGQRAVWEVTGRWETVQV